MGQDKKATFKALSSLLASKKVKELPLENSKYLIISDIHFGDGGKSDDFRNNVDALKAALQYYNDNNYTLILLGDIEELWQFSLPTIVKRYKNRNYKYMKAFGNDRYIRVFGNHDIDWSTFRDPALKNPEKVHHAHEALKLVDSSGNVRVLLVHGHQGSTESDKLSWLSRIAVKGFKLVEPVAKAIGLYGHSSATKSQIATDYEQIMYAWARENMTILICGHSHRAIFASISYAVKLHDKLYEAQKEANAVKNNKEEYKKKRKVVEKLLDELMDETKKGRDIDPSAGEDKTLPCYFNDGCGLYTDGITNLEIDGDNIRLVKWDNEGKQTVFDKGLLSDYIDKVCA
jgi:UDP-2,3-diacylglucosamine pyrophosphatase LpxH